MYSSNISDGEKEKEKVVKEKGKNSVDTLMKQFLHGGDEYYMHSEVHIKASSKGKTSEESYMTMISVSKQIVYVKVFSTLIMAP